MQEAFSLPCHLVTTLDRGNIEETPLPDVPVTALRRRNLPMPIAQAKLIALGSKTGSLGETSKMPGMSWGISAGLCKRGLKLSKDPKSVCHGCYAKTNFYATWKPVLMAHARRVEGLEHPEWVDAMVTLIIRFTKPSDPYFRWFDSGDLQSVEHLEKIVRVVERTPWVKHWLPTHEPFMVRTFLKRGGEVPVNLTIRISADYVDKPPKKVPGVHDFPTSTVHTGHGNDRVVQVSGRRKDSIECKSYTVATRKGAAGECRNCRACWNPDVQNISYPKH